MPTVETQLRIATRGASLYAMAHMPAGLPRGAVLFCGPLFEEQKSAQRAMVETARAMADAGLAVLRFDYRGCGESPGDFEALTLERAREDAQAAWARLCARVPSGVPGIVLGLRVGATLALELAAALPDVAAAILWEPTVDGRCYLDEELRRKLAQEMLTFGRSLGRREALTEALAGGRSVDFSGYPLSAALYRDLCRINLLDTARRVAGRAVWIANITHHDRPQPPFTTLRETLEGRDNRVACEAILLPPFWSLVGYVDIGALIARMLKWLQAGPLQDANHGRAAPDPEAFPSPSAAEIQPTAGGETPVSVTLGTETLRGILHAPVGAANGVGVAFLHGWSGCRLGPHGMFVKMARRLATQGFAVLRLDFRGRGESDGATAAATIQDMVADARCAMDALGGEPGVRALVLLGICSGGKVALLTAAEDPRVAGLCLWSAEAMGAARGAGATRKTLFALRAYGRKLLQPATG